LKKNEHAGLEQDVLRYQVFLDILLLVVEVVPIHDLVGHSTCQQLERSFVQSLLKKKKKN
jgi:hypothetical protein